MPTARARDPQAAARAQATSFGYLAKRWDQIQYATFRAAGYPIGSGCVESANKLVVEARLKGPGMHWARSHVTPLVALRAALCSERWDATWPQIAAQHQRVWCGNRIWPLLAMLPRGSTHVAGHPAAPGT